MHILDLIQMTKEGSLIILRKIFRLELYRNIYNTIYDSQEMTALTKSIFINLAENMLP